MSGSAATASIGSALQAAAGKLTDELHRLGRKNKKSVLHGAGRDQLVLRDGGVYRQNRPDAGESFGALLARAGQPFLEAEADSRAPVMGMK